MRTSFELDWWLLGSALAARGLPIRSGDQGPIAASRLEVIRWRGYDIRVPPLELQLEVSRRRGLGERVAIIERALL